MRLEINYKKNCKKQTWRLLLNNQWINEEIKEYLETNENTTFQNLWDTAKAVLTGKLIAPNAYIRKEERSQINDLSSHLKNLEKEE